MDWAESEPEEGTVQTIRVSALQQMNQYLYEQMSFIKACVSTIPTCLFLFTCRI